MHHNPNFGCRPTLLVTISPAIVELSIKENIFEIDLYFSVEIFLADIDASIITDTNETNKSEVYDDLRARDSAEIETIFKSKSNLFIDLITVKSEEEMLQVKFLDIKVSENRDVTIPRESKITLAVATKTDDVEIIFGWDKKLGPLIVRRCQKRNMHLRMIQNTICIRLICLQGIKFSAQ